MTDDFTHMTHDADRTPILWTDGAVSSLPIRTKTGCLWPGGWAVILRHEGATHRTAGYHRQTNSQRMEMMAVVMALYQCRSRKLRGAVIYSNSDYSACQCRRSSLAGRAISRYLNYALQNHI